MVNSGCVLLLLLVVFAFVGEVYNQPPQAVWFNDVVSAAAHVYGLHDNQQASMDCLHVARSTQQGQWFKYYGVYHTLIGTEFQVRLAASADLFSWTFVTTLLNNADMPYVYQMGTNDQSWILLLHEQWMKPNSQSPSQIGFKMYYTEEDLFVGKYAATFNAPLMSGITLMGTPNVYSAVMQQDNGYWYISGLVGFHYNEKRDRVLQADFQYFADPKKSTVWKIIGNSSYDLSLANEFGLAGNIGDRDFNGNTGTYIQLQEGNLGPASPTNWTNWRLFMYLWDNEDKQMNYPTGSGTWYALHPQTHGGSIAFGNPTFTVLPHPSNSSSIVCVTYFIFSQGSGPGEAGSLLFYHLLD